MRNRPGAGLRRRTTVLSSLVLCVAAIGATTASLTPAHAADKTPTGLTITSSTGLQDGAVKHVWLIILENKSYDATFTGLNKNSYLWKTLPAQGNLLTNYYGTGHFSQDNYESMVSGQGPEPDTQLDCGLSYNDFGTNKNIITTGKVSRPNTNYGQVLSPAGANGAYGANGCVYPRNVPTLFNQLDAAGKTWKGYNQDLRAQSGRDDAVCGGPGTSANDPTTNPTQVNNPSAYPGVVSFTGAQANDQYVAKHSPFPWFHSLIDGSSTTPADGGTDCDAHHVVNLDNTDTGLVHDLQSASSTPNFSWITPTNCSDAHDAVCKGNNLSGAFDADGNPQYQANNYNPENAQPTNYTGGLYASDLFLKWYVPLIEASPAFADGGLIDVTFDEANPPFSYSGNSFYDANQYGPTSKDKPNYTQGLAADAAGQNVHGRNTHSEPTGPNTPLIKDSSGNQLSPGPGDNAFIDRPAACTSTSPPTPSGCVPGIVRGGSGSTPGPRTDPASGSNSSAALTDAKITSLDMGRQVTDTVDSPSPIPPNSYVGQVTNVGRTATSPTDTAVASSFQLVDANGTPVAPTAAVSSITLAGETSASDPLFDATDATPGGGDTGSVLISPYITPGSTTARFYNHYSWLASMEDLFDVGRGTSTATLTPGVGSISGGLDGKGHLGFAAQPALGTFGPDVFTNPGGQASGSASPAAKTPAEGLLLALPLLALGSGEILRRRIRTARAGR